jgi:hypothetical protein
MNMKKYNPTMIALALILGLAAITEASSMKTTTPPRRPPTGHRHHRGLHHERRTGTPQTRSYRRAGRRANRQ